MPAGFVLKINEAGIREVLKSAGVQADIKARADRIAAKANGAAGITDGFVSEVEVGKNRARARVITATAEGMVAEAKDRTLTRAFDAGRG